MTAPSRRQRASLLANKADTGNHERHSDEGLQRV
ncbi:hypothetical protein D623_10032799 [Myotis brandtii]|uniref:Uncharacterized protein n=1 Tax=Myotis brandtii TaxID=109478 RepID=S7P7C3_MYOBR|nr:hypothetical protein D623_10032799 [Myotis brandtii]